MPKPGTPKTLLILEDELLYLELIVLHCEKIGFDVISARSVDEALMLMNDLKTVDLTPKIVDAIWLDHFLPEKMVTFSRRKYSSTMNGKIFQFFW